jgi:hypothetical protein
MVGKPVACRVKKPSPVFNKSFCVVIFVLSCFKLVPWYGHTSCKKRPGTSQRKIFLGTATLLRLLEICNIYLGAN